MTPRRPYIDAKFEVIDGPYRIGDRHRSPQLKSWRYTGHRDRFGVPVWYRPPVISRRLILNVAALLLALFVLMAATGVILTR